VSAAIAETVDVAVVVVAAGVREAIDRISWETKFVTQTTDTDGPFCPTA
jgi:hypothetical protein